jgi:hypothetical protein
MLTTLHDECLAIDGIMYRCNCRPSRFRWRHQSLRRAAFPASKSHLVWAQVLRYPRPLIWRKPYLIRPRISTNKGWDILVPCLHGSPNYFNKMFCQEEFVRTTVIRDIWQWLGVESVRGGYSIQEESHFRSLVHVMGRSRIV